LKAIRSTRSVRYAVLLSFLTALFSAAFTAGLPVNAAPVATHGSTGQALALRASLRALVPAAGHAKTFKDLVGAGPQDLRRAPDGRFIYNRAALRPGALLKPNAAGTTPQVDEAVQTYDVFSPPPGFTPTQGPSLTPTNLTPVWTADETMLVFSSNRTATGTVGTRFHIWAIPVNGGTPLQLTSSAGPNGGGEFFPALSADNNRQLAFTSDANSMGVQNLYSIPVPTQTVAVSSLLSPTIRTDPLAVAVGGLDFSGVQRPTFVPGNSDEIVFSAFSTTGTYKGHNHLYFLYVHTGGSDPSTVSLPAKITDGPADDTDPSYSQDGQLIAFASTAATLTATGSAPGPDPNTSLLLTAGPRANRSIFLAGGGGRFGFGTATNGGQPVTAVGTDNFGPAWSSLRRNPYTNPAPGFEYIAFARGAGPTAPHDIYYLQVLRNTDASGETARSNEGATTPQPARTPIDQVNAGDANLNDKFGGYVSDTFINQTPQGALLPQPFSVTGGTAVPAPTPPLAVNTTNDPGTPPQIYQTNRNGTFTYTFGSLTPFANYRVRLHLSDPKDTAPGQRVFTVSINGTVSAPTGQNSPNIDIVAQAQSAPGRIDGLVTDATGTPIAATLTVADASGNAVTTTPSPLVSTASADPNSGLNYSGAVPQGTYNVTATANGVSQTQAVTISSAAVTRLDFTLRAATLTATGTVTNGVTTAPAPNVPVRVTDPTTNAVVAATTTGADGTYTLPVPAGTFNITANPATGTGLATLTKSVTFAAPAAPATSTVTNFALAGGNTVGTVGGLITDSATGQPLSGATVRIQGAGYLAIVTTGASTTPATGAQGDGKPQNFSVNLPGAATPGTQYSVTFSLAGKNAGQATPSVINGAFVRADNALVTTAPTVGQNTAVVVEYAATAGSFNQNFLGAGSLTTITVAFNPVSGDPPIVEGIEILSDNNADTSSGYGDLGFNNTFQTTTTPTIFSVLGGVGTDASGNPQPKVTIQFGSSGAPSSFNLYRSPAAPTSTNMPPASNSGAEGNIPYIANIPATGSGQIVDTNVAPGAEYYYQITAVFTQSLTPEGATEPNGTINAVVKLNTDDNAGQTGAGGNAFDDVYPTWSPFVSIFSIAYSSNRSVTYDDPTTGASSETALSVPQGGKLTGAGTVGAQYAGVLVSQVVNLDPPTLLPYSGNEIVHIADSTGRATRTGITPGQPVTVTVRMSNREAGIDDTGAATLGPKGAQVYLQIKNPNSKYQDAQNLEHKVFARDLDFRLQRNNPNASNPFLMDSGSSAQLINGGGYNLIDNYFKQFFGSIDPNPGRHPISGNSQYFDSGFNRIADRNGQIENYPNRGAVGGTEDAPPDTPAPGPATNGSDTISVGHEDFSNSSFSSNFNHESVFDNNGKPVTDPDTKQIVTNPPGADPDLFVPWGPEFECQVVNPQFANNPNATAAGDVSRSDFRDPFWLAGVDDQQPFSGQNKVRPTANLTASAGGVSAPAEWLQMTRLPDSQQDGQGGVLYTVNWTTPTSGSDFYLDVIAFDKATPPPTFGGNVYVNPTNSRQRVFSDASNWRIYDNIWGFSTASSIGNNDILVVSDYALGQKFAASTFGGQRGLLNLIPKFFGAESYVTDIDVNLLPNAIERHTVITGATPDIPNREALALNNETSLTGRDFGTQFVTGVGGTLNPVFNGLGVGSYADRFIDDGVRIDNVPAVRSQQYSIWRTLARGPVPDSVYAAYLPTARSQPAVSDTSGTTKITFPAAPRVAVANRCIVWISPFTGDVLAGAGTLADTATQQALRNFVLGDGTAAHPGGGRLCVSGQDVGSTLTQNGQTNNAAGGFLFDVLNASLATPNGGTHIPAVTANNVIGQNRITITPNYDGFVIGNYVEINPGATITTVPPGQRLMRISNNYGANIFSHIYPTYFNYAGNWRTDGSLDNLGPYIQPYPTESIFGRSRTSGTTVLNTNSVVSAIDTITPGKNAQTDITLAPFTNPIPPTDNGNVAAASGPGGVGLIYTENPITAAGAGNGSKVVYATFGLEALGTEYYKQTLTNFKPSRDIFTPRNQRQSILHNIVDYLRTGSIAGTIRSTSGNGVVGSGVAGATVYLQSAFGPAIPGRGTFSATTDSAGNYRIDGIEPGNYTLAAYRTGFIRATSNPGVIFTVEGDSLQQASLTLVPASPGSISGKVTDTSNNLVAGASVVFTSTDGQIYSTTTDANGNYTLSSVAPSTYTGTATKTGFGSQTQNTLTVASNAPLVVNFTLQPGPGAVTGRVVDTAGNPISGAKVFFSSGSPATVAATATTDATGAYTIAALTAGTYNVTASATGFGSSAPISVVVVGATTTTVPDITLGAVANGTLGGLVTGTSSTTPVAGVTLTIVNTGTGLTVSPSPTTTGTATAASDGGQINYGPVMLGQGTYTVTATKNGASAGTQTVTIAANTFSRLDFTGVSGLPPLHTFPAGLNFLSLPFDYSSSSFDSLFGALNTAPTGTMPNGNRSYVEVWNPLVGQYAHDPNPPADVPRLGVGYWVFLKNAVGLTQPGGATAGAISVALHPSWNQIGVPSTSPVPVANLSFDMGGGSVLSFANAAGSANHIVSPTLYRYDGSNYQAVSANDSLQPYQAYWIKVFVDTTVRIPTGR